VLDGNRVGALERYLGVPVAVAAPQAIYVPISAYGQVGPMAMLAGHDNNILALGGNLSYTQSDADGLPTVFSAPLADLFAGQMAAMGALAALVGRGQLTAPMPTMIDASMLHAGFFLNVLQLSARNGLDYQPPQPSAEWMNGGRADYRPYRCSDGKCIFFGLIEAWAAKRFFKALGRADLGDMLAHTDRLRTALEALFAQRTQAEWVALGTELDACITAVNDLETAVHQPQVQSLGRMQTVEARDIGDMEVPSFPLGFGPQSLPIQAQPDAPLLGEHNHTILQNLLGMPQTTIDGLLADGILIQVPRKTAQP
jgi:crotonobetainyl-CoA:carnitine CoA-transferase CaiB-like acyl-CoA transferase